MSKNNRNNSDKLTSTGVSLSSILKEQDLKRKAEEEENNQIETFVKDKSCSNYFLYFVFVLIHFFFSIFSINFRNHRKRIFCDP